MIIKLEIRNFDEIYSISVDGTELDNTHDYINLITKLCKERLSVPELREVLHSVLCHADYNYDLDTTDKFNGIKTWSNL